MSRMLADAGCHCRMSRTTCSHSITHTQSHANLDVVSPVSPVILFSRCWLVRAFVPVYQASSLYLKPRFPAGCPRSAGSSLASFMVAVLSMIPPASTQPALPHRSHTASRQSLPLLYGAWPFSSSRYRYRLRLRVCLCLSIFACAASTAVRASASPSFVRSCHASRTLSTFCMAASYTIALFFRSFHLHFGFTNSHTADWYGLPCFVRHASATSVVSVFRTSAISSCSAVSSYLFTSQRISRHLSRFSISCFSFQQILETHLREARACRISANAMDR